MWGEPMIKLSDFPNAQLLFFLLRLVSQENDNLKKFLFGLIFIKIYILIEKINILTQFSRIWPIFNNQ